MNQEQLKELLSREKREDRTVRVWCVYDKTRGEVESYHPSYAWASERLTRYAEFRPAGTDASISEIRVNVEGKSHRVLTTAWDSYRAMLLVAADGQEATVGQRLLKRAALGACRSQRRVQADARQLRAGCLPKKRPPAHELDLPEVITVDRQSDRLVPPLARTTALRLAAERNRQRLAEGAAWDGQWSVVVEHGEILPITWTSLEFAGDLGIERLIYHRVVRLVRPTEDEIAQFTCLPTVA